MSISWNFKVSKPIYMIVFGHSVKELEDRWDEFKDHDVVWATMNNSKYLERFVKFQFDIVVHYCYHQNCELFNAKHVLTASQARGNSLMEFILQCDENGVKRLVIFGADGYSDKETPYIYGVKGDQGQHKNECDVFNRTLPKKMNLEIINVSKDSHYALNNVSYDEYLEKYYGQ